MPLRSGSAEQENLPTLEHADDGGLPTAAQPLWTVRHKIALLQAIRSGQIDLTEACARYGLQEKEIRAWAALMQRHGLPVVGTPRVSSAPAQCRKLRLIPSRDEP